MNNIRLLLVTALMLCFSKAQSQIITTVVGDGISGYAGNGAAATAAEINKPHGIAVDRYGNLYIADHNNNVVRKVDTAGIITTIAGTGAAGYNGDGIAATSAQLNLPFEVAVDTLGNVYISDNTNHRIRKIAAGSGIISTIAGTGIGGYIGDGMAATSSEIQYPGGLALDLAGNIYIADQYNHRIREVNAATGIISTIAGTGVASYWGDGGAATSAELSYPNYIHVDDTGNVYVTDNGNHRIRKINTSGVINTVAGNGTGGYIGDGMAATSSELDFPGGATIDGNGNIYIADYLNSRIRFVNTSGIISTIAGTGVAGYSGDGIVPTSAEINNAVDITIDTKGNLYIADYNNSRIRKIGINHPPHFIHGDEQSLSICENTENTSPTSINPLLAIIDTDLNNTETWSLVAAPLHGTVIASYSIASTGSIITPTGLTYAPVIGFVGIDSFKVKINDGIAQDITNINVTVNPAPNAGIITGADTVCVGRTVHLFDTAFGGIWSSTSSASVSPAGLVTGSVAGVDTVIYTVMNTCGIQDAFFYLTVFPASHCNAGVNTIINQNTGVLNISPNPNSGSFTLNLLSGMQEEAWIVISNILGEKVKEFVCETNHTVALQMDVPSGVYFISATSAHEKWVHKILITR